LLFTPPTALGFWTAEHESHMLDVATDAQRGPHWVLSTIGLLPLFLWTFFQLAIGSVSGMIGGLQGLIVLALVLLTGERLRQLAVPPWWTAVIQAVLLYWLILPQGALLVM
jgi:hypothetical protein